MPFADPGDPDQCIVWGYITDARGNAQVGVTVYFTVDRTDVMTTTGKNVRKEQESVVSDADGYYEMSLFRASGLVPDTAKYTIEIPAIGFKKKISIPDAVDARLDTLL